MYFILLFCLTDNARFMSGNLFNEKIKDDKVLKISDYIQLILHFTCIPENPFFISVARISISENFKENRCFSGIILLKTLHNQTYKEI